MATGDGWTSAMLVGLAEHLAANSIGTWSPSGVYTANQVGIVLRGIPQAPDRIITLAPYVVTPVAGVQDLIVGVQIRMRGTQDPRVVEDLGDAIFELLDSSGYQVWGTDPNQVSIVDVYRQSYTSLGQDSNDRWEISHNYYVEAMRLTANRTD